MSETCPVCESELRLIAYGWVCPNAECPIDELSDNDLALARRTADARVAEAVKPWVKMCGDLWTIADEYAIQTKVKPPRVAVVLTDARDLLDTSRESPPPKRESNGV